MTASRTSIVLNIMADLMSNVVYVGKQCNRA